MKKKVLIRSMMVLTEKGRFLARQDIQESKAVNTTGVSSMLGRVLPRPKRVLKRLNEFRAVLKCLKESL